MVSRSIAARSRPCRSARSISFTVTGITSSPAASSRSCCSTSSASEATSTSRAKPWPTLLSTSQRRACALSPRANATRYSVESPNASCIASAVVQRSGSRLVTHGWCSRSGSAARRTSTITRARAETRPGPTVPSTASSSRAPGCSAVSAASSNTVASTSTMSVSSSACCPSYASPNASLTRSSASSGSSSAARTFISGRSDVRLARAACPNDGDSWWAAWACVHVRPASPNASRRTGDAREARGSARDCGGPRTQPGGTYGRSSMSPTPQRIAVVTGGGSGIGAAVAPRARRGRLDRRPRGSAHRPRWTRPSLAASALTGTLEAIPTDVTDEASVRHLFDAVVERHGRVDLLFNNAGIGAPASTSTRSSSRRGTRWSRST